ncbi:hypothetical protein AX16_008403 [Volvariella volvacea WC 439]|nr:hypothetical protein AX16_008403 [Volvariella volvacea WC 439]
MAPIEEELQRVFKEANEDVPFGDNGGLLLKECVNICKTHNLKAEDLYAKWAAASYNAHNRHSIISRFTISTLAEVKRKLERDLDSAVKASGRVGRGAATGAMRAPRAFPARMAANATALANRASSAVGQGSGSGMARDMDLDGVPQVKVKVEEDGSVVAIGSDSVTFKGPQMDEESKKKRRYRYMYEKITERSEALDDRIDEFGELVREHYKIPELGDPTSSTDEEIVVVGRITHDYDSASPTSKLTEATLTLESSRILSAGALIPLAFANPVHVRGGPRGVAGMGFFPGTIVALKGKSGVKFMASEILAIPPLKPSPAAAGAASELKIDSDPESPSFSAWVASGPFTQDSDLEYRPWQSLLTALKAGKPNVLILVGPFVDSAHPKFQSGDVESTPTGIFTTKFYQPLRAYLNTNPGGIAILVPSVRDLISDHAVFPQSEFTYLPPRQPRHDTQITVRMCDHTHPLL